MIFRTVLTLVVALIISENLAFADEGTSVVPETASVRQGPRPLKAGEHGVGQWIPDTPLTDLAGNSHSLSELAKSHQAVVIAMTSTSCPLSKKYLPTLVELSEVFRGDVAWVIVNPIATDKLDAMNVAVAQFGDNVIYVHDHDGVTASRVGAMTTTDVIVMDASRTVVYHGAIDDQYGLGYALESPRNRYLADALTTIKTGQTPATAATEAPGCRLASTKTTNTSPLVTYHNRISRLVQAHCVECHRDGGVGPFSLDSLDDVVAHAGMIEQVVKQETMPPWFASEDDSGDQTSRSPWINDRSLAETEKQDLLDWTAGGMPAGDPSNAPLPRTFTSDWEIGKPDAVFRFAKPQPVKATGVMPYKNVDVQTDLAEDKWVQAIEIKPGDRSVVHHVLVFAQGTGQTANERDGFWGIYVPGNSSLSYPDGFAKRLPKNATLRFQMHYTPNGTATTDQTSIGLVFAKTPPKHEVRVEGIFNDKISIPAGADNHPEVAKLTIPADARVMGFLPHMHLRGKAARYELIHADGQVATLLDVPRYDFNWQLLYRYREPLLVSQGDTIRFTAWYDNSAKNPANPDPTETVGWGPQTYDEMQVGYVEYYLPNVVPGQTVASPSSSDPSSSDPSSSDLPTGSSRRAALFRRLDINRDGVITKAEVRQQMPGDANASGPTFDRLDEDGNGEITPAELEKL